MASEKINVKIEADYNDRDAKAAIKDAEKLDDLDPKIEIDADADQARAAIRDVTEELEDVPSAADKVAAADRRDGLQDRLRVTRRGVRRRRPTPRFR